MTLVEFDTVIRDGIATGVHIKPLLILWAIAIITILPLTYLRKVFSISVGYGAAITTMSLVLMWTFQVPIISSPSLYLASPSKLLVLATLLYGVRLTTFLVLRQCTVLGIHKQSDMAEGMSRVKSNFLAVTVAFLYACFELPVLYALREDYAWSGDKRIHIRLVEYVGLIMCYLGLLLETVADHQKYLVKRRFGAAYDETKFVGPTGGVYSLCRHPNYFGEVLVWIGIYITSAYSLGTNIIAWVCSTIGLWSIVSIMLGSTVKLEQKHQEKYGKQEKFQAWRNHVRAPLIPFVEKNLTIWGIK
jgi:steroid 5-alpha reductase family enzyme